jgi:O-acetyl-ADP-ribose deacetylase (regulator of RNase III)
MTSGVGAALRSAGGIEIHNAAVANAPAKVGAVVVTEAGKLRAELVFHAVVLSEDVGGRPSASAVQTVVKAVLSRAAHEGAETLCLPLISTGVGDGRFARGLHTILETIESSAEALDALDTLALRIVARTDEEMAQAREAAETFLPADAKASDDADAAADFLKSLLGD